MVWGTYRRREPNVAEIPDVHPAVRSPAAQADKLGDLRANQESLQRRIDLLARRVSRRRSTRICHIAPLPETPTMPGMLQKPPAFVPRYYEFESISLQRRVERTRRSLNSGGKLEGVRRSRLFGQLPGRDKLKAGSRLLV